MLEASAMTQTASYSVLRDGNALSSRTQLRGNQLTCRPLGRC